MRILLVSTASFEPPRGGSTRSNRIWMEQLAARGHRCRAICGTPPMTGAPSHTERTLPAGIEVAAYREIARAPSVLRAEIDTYQPDWVLVSSEDLSHSLLREACRSAAGRVVYLAHTPQFFPFGCESWNPDTRAANDVRSCAGVVVIGSQMAEYLRQHLDVEARVIHPNLYGRVATTSDPSLASWVLMINPCAVKGVSIFKALAEQFPGVPFAALEGWGTTARDRSDLQSHPNITVLNPVEHIDEVLRHTRVLIVPSLWYEGFGLIVMEAMLRGIPVLASSYGGLLEAKQGMRFALSINPIHEYLPHFDEVHMPVPVIPPQDLSPWSEALRKLWTDRLEHAAESERSRIAASAFVNTLDENAMETFLLQLLPSPKRALGDRINQLSPVQRAALLARLRATHSPE